MDIIFKNVMESLVFIRLEDMLPRLDCCKCEKCRMDIAAYVLNHLPPKYVATHKGELYSRVDALSSQHETDITTMIVRGAHIVKANPKH